MSMEKLLAEAEGMIAAINESTGDDRVALHAKYHAILERIRFSGHRVPQHLRDIDLELTDEEVEDGFDNMPV